MTWSGTSLRAAAVLDPAGITGSSLPAASWSALGCDPGEGRLEWSRAQGAALRELRRLDLLAQALVLLGEAAGLATALEPELRGETALVFASQRGCLDADLGFQASLAPGAEPSPGLFPWTLPSTCLGELARRHGLMGPSLCLGADEERREAGPALGEARALLAAGEARAAVVVFGDALSARRARPLGLAPRLELGLVLLAPGGAGVLEPARLAASDDPWTLLRAGLARGEAA